MLYRASSIECLGFGLYSGLLGWFGLQAIARTRRESFVKLMRFRMFLAVDIPLGQASLAKAALYAYSRLM